MKIVVQMGPDEAELALNELEEEDFIIDQETYCFIRDEIFIKGVEKFIHSVAPGEWQETVNLEGAEKVRRWFSNKDLINKYYREYNKLRQRFYFHNNAIYTFEFLGFMNVGDEIQLIKLDMHDIVNLLNQLAEKPLRKLLRKFGVT